ncbi:MAG TPA: DnaJ domain-containing protein [Azospirillaceae bacterium]|nr:DnaJ domain-containing protein [Azospirillaceae bacterium]
MAKERAAYRRFSFEEPPPQVRRCDMQGCEGEGAYRAPKGRDRLNDYHWFCLDHVREYNRAWDFYRGMSEKEIERALRNDITWQRPTWPMGSWQARERAMREKVMRDFAHGADEAESAARHAPPPRRKGPEDEARAVLDVSADADFPEIKARYRELVKRHHPDANGGDKAAEEKLKQINQAYTTLKACYGA